MAQAAAEDAAGTTDELPFRIRPGLVGEMLRFYDQLRRQSQPVGRFEALIVAARRNVGEEMTRLIDGLGFEIVSVTPASARRIAAAYARWGRGAHPAGLNFGDCFSYEVAKERSCPLLYVGADFSRTDLESALSS